MAGKMWTQWCWAVPTILFRPIIQNVMGKGVKLIDSGAECAGISQSCSIILKLIGVGQSPSIIPLHNDSPMDLFEKLLKTGWMDLTVEHVTLWQKRFTNTEMKRTGLSELGRFQLHFLCFGDVRSLKQFRRIFITCWTNFRSLVQIHGVLPVLASLSFLIRMIKGQDPTSLELRQQAGATLVVEGDKLVAVYLPEKGLPLTDFLDRPSRRPLIWGWYPIATKNEGKTKEFRQFFAQLGHKVENLNAYPDLPDVAETGLTFEENAKAQAETIAELTGKMVLADDSGPKVDAGRNARCLVRLFSGPDATDAKVITPSSCMNWLWSLNKRSERPIPLHLVMANRSPKLSCRSGLGGLYRYGPSGVRTALNMIRSFCGRKWQKHRLSWAWKKK